ncbi:hypothetical protein [Ammoniphilus oxalaticus]|nr:hypothetical protein [Ammoniphilus oxalaticus]
MRSTILNVMMKGITTRTRAFGWHKRHDEGHHDENVSILLA